MYKQIVRPLLYKLDAERAHYLASGVLQTTHSLQLADSLVKGFYNYEHPLLETEFCGLKFKNPIGLAAGFDKNAKWIEALSLLGFGHVEIGTLTPIGQPGNDKPRLFRLAEDEALINRMGFNNDGVEEALLRLKKLKRDIPVGGNIGKNKVTPNEEAPNDYLKSFVVLYDWVDYFTVNVSSPNTPGLRALQGKEELKKIFNLLFEHRSKQDKAKPVLLKIAPDLNFDQLDDIIKLVDEQGIDGLICTNTTLSRDGLRSREKGQMGGLSGKPVRERSTEVIKYIHTADPSIPIIGVGGIHSADAAIEKLEAGAKLIQVYTGFVYEGPALIKRINKAIVKYREQ